MCLADEPSHRILTVQDNIKVSGAESVRWSGWLAFLLEGLLNAEDHFSFSTEL